MASNNKPSTKLLKLLLILIDSLIFLSGLIMLIGGSVVQSQINTQTLSHSINGFSVQAGSIVCIIFGLFILGLSLVGLFSAVKNHHRFLHYYAILMSFIFIVQFVTGIAGLSVRNNSNFGSILENMFKSELSINATQSSINERDTYQKVFKCCGWDGPNDYLNVTLNVTQLQAPYSCCKSATSCDKSDKKTLFDNGCKAKITEAFQTVIQVACSMLITFSMFNLLSITLSFLLARQIRVGYQYA